MYAAAAPCASDGVEGVLGSEALDVAGEGGVEVVVDTGGPGAVLMDGTLMVDD